MQVLRKNFKWYFLFGLSVTTAIIWVAVFEVEAYSGKLILDVFDVGQGDGIYIQVSGNQILIDGGPDNSILSKLGKVMPFWDRSIDLLILTHPHLDHIGGALEVLKRYSIGMVMESGVSHSIPEYEEWHRLLQEKNVKVITARGGQTLSLGPAASLDILTPFQSFIGEAPKNVHDSMVVSRLRYGSTAALFMGDAEKSLEYRLLYESLNSKFYSLNSDLLKVGHHGSKTSTSEDFLRAVSPKFAVISVGRKNRYGHPHQEVLDRLKEYGARVFRTDLDGDIRFVSDGADFSQATN